MKGSINVNRLISESSSPFPSYFSNIWLNVNPSQNVGGKRGGVRGGSEIWLAEAEAGVLHERDWYAEKWCYWHSQTHQRVDKNSVCFDILSKMPSSF